MDTFAAPVIKKVCPKALHTPMENPNTDSHANEWLWRFKL